MRAIRGAIIDGGSPHMTGELLKTMAGIDIRHIPYKNITQGFSDLFAGEVSMAFYHVPVIYPHVQSGRLRALGIATSERSPIAPEVPPISDTVKGYDILLDAWQGVAANLLIVGDGPERTALEQQAQQLGIGERVFASFGSKLNFDNLTIDNEDFRAALAPLALAVHMDRLMLVRIENDDDPEVFV